MAKLFSAYINRFTPLFAPRLIRAKPVFVCYVRHFSHSGNADLQLSEACVMQLKKVCQDGDFLRVAVDGGGCSGFQYMFELDKEITQEDRIFEKDGAKIVVDCDSLEYLKGSTIDYHEELIRSAFRVIDNPKAEQGCSCGASFNIKL